MKALCRALLALNVLYCALAAAQEGLPGWHMFEAVERTDYTLTDRDGRAVDIRDWLPRGANIVDRSELRRVVRFVCEKERARAPFTYEEPGGVRLLLAGDCKVHVPR